MISLLWMYQTMFNIPFVTLQTLGLQSCRTWCVLSSADHDLQLRIHHYSEVLDFFLPIFVPFIFFYAKGAYEVKTTPQQLF